MVGITTPRIRVLASGANMQGNELRKKVKIH
jgi:hypothetical protein